MIKATPEQEQAIQAYLTGENLRIEALAGTGKTTTLRMLVERGSPRGGKILYTSFGRRVIDEAKAKFPKTCRVTTNHGLAWGVGITYHKAGRLQQRISPSELVRQFGWSDSTFAPYADARTGAFAVMETIANFCQSPDEQVTSHHATPLAVRLSRGQKADVKPIAGVLANYAGEVWESMMSPHGGMPISHDHYLKKWALGNPRINASTILVDESQDSNGVIVNVLRNQDAQLVVVGDRRQAIYGWRGAVDAMEAYDVVHTTNLTQSFRFGPEIASVANEILVDQCNSNVMLSGDPNQPGIVGECPTPHCYLARTNASLVGQIFEIERQTPRYRVGVVGGVIDLVKLVEAAEKLRYGERVQHPDLMEFADWQEVEEAVHTDAYQHLRTLVNLVSDFGTKPLLDKLDTLRGNEKDPEGCDALLSTAHKAKGSEFESVRLLDDFKPKGPKENPGLFGWTPEEGNLLYVAVTRARKHLDIVNCTAVTDSLSFATQSQLFFAAQAQKGQADAESNSASDPGHPTDQPDAWLRLGTWDHPLIEGGKVTLEGEGSGVRVVVEAAGYQLFEATGVAMLGEKLSYAVNLQVGSAKLQVPLAAMATEAHADAVPVFRVRMASDTVVEPA